MKKLENKVALITGAAGVIGAAAGGRLWAEGARGILADKNEEAAQHLAEKLGVWAFPIGMDIGDEASVAAGVNAGTAHFGSRLDILFNNAALTDQKTQSQDADVTTTPVDVWTQTLQVNTTGYMLCCRYAIPLMVRDRKSTRLNSSH